MYMKPGRLFSKRPQNLKGYEALADLQAPAPHRKRHLRQAGFHKVQLAFGSFFEIV